MHSISVIIPTFNEADNLKELLPLLNWANEIIVIDSFSTDDTLRIVQAYDVHFVQHKYEGPAAQKNRAIAIAKNDWIFILDADERPSAGLIKEIQSLLILSNIPFEAYWIYRTNYFMGNKIKYSGWQNDKVIRFIHKEHCLYNHKKVHEEIETNGKVGYLSSKIDHYTYRSLGHFDQKTRRYAQWSAEDYKAKTGSIGLFHFLINHFLDLSNIIFLKGVFWMVNQALLLVVTWPGVFFFAMLIFLKVEKKRNLSSYSNFET
jgi:glycosyltransferase involved in cell wall biosynthesis